MGRYRTKEALQEGVNNALRHCMDKGLESAGREFSECVAYAVWDGPAPEFKLSRDGYPEMLRNFSCETGAASKPSRSVSIQVDSDAESCGADEEREEEARLHGYGVLNKYYTYLPATVSNDNTIAIEESLDVEAALDRCSALPNCEAVTFQSNSRSGSARIQFKSSVAGLKATAGWHTYRRKKPATCAARWSRQQPAWRMVDGYTPANNEISQATMTVHEAKAKCAKMADCKAFCHTGPPTENAVRMYFASKSKVAVSKNKFTAYLAPQRSSIQPPSQSGPETIRVDIIREWPLVAIARNFVTKDICNVMVQRAAPTMKPSRTIDGLIDLYRNSTSGSVPNDYQDPDDAIGRHTLKSFSLVRNLTGYAVYPPGQERLVSIQYGPGQQYRPHCDGGCSGPYRRGERIATTITYCRLAEEGGATTFTDDILKIAPNLGDMLIFAYWLGGDATAGRIGQHSGCPVVRGEKWVATQWYREGVTEEWDSMKALKDLKEWGKLN